MKLDVGGDLFISNEGYERIQKRLDNENMSIQEAFEAELQLAGIPLKKVYSITFNMGQSKYTELYSRLVCEVKSGRKTR